MMKYNMYTIPIEVKNSPIKTITELIKKVKYYVDKILHLYLTLKQLNRKVS